LQFRRDKPGLTTAAPVGARRRRRIPTPLPWAAPCIVCR